MKTRRFAVVASRFNPEITDRLLENCLRRLARAGISGKDVTVVRVPGAFEIPWAAQRLASRGRYAAVVCLGAVLKGQTPQNDYIASSAISHLHDVSLSTGVPCVLGIITPRTYAQAKARTRGALDRGKEAAEAALEMAELRHGTT